MLEEFFKEKASEKELERKTTFQKSEKSNLEPVNTAKEISKIAGVSHDAIYGEKAEENRGTRADILQKSAKSLFLTFPVLQISATPDFCLCVLVTPRTGLL